MDATHAPHDPHIAIGVPPIQLILVIQVDAEFYGLLWAVSPLQDLQPMPSLLHGRQHAQACQIRFILIGMRRQQTVQGRKRTVE